MVVPPIVVLYDVLVARKKFADSAARQAVPMFFCVMLILTTMNAQVTIVGGVRGHLSLSKPHLLAVDAVILWKYVAMLLWPTTLCVLYDPPTQGIALQMALAISGWGAVAWTLWRVRDSRPLLTLAGAAWLLLFLPVLNLFPLTTLMNDRYLYLPCVPLFAVLLQASQTMWTTGFAARFKCATRPAALGLTALLGFWTLGTLNYLPVWRNPESLWSYARVHAPTLAVVHIQWALTLEDLGRKPEAAAALRYALNHCHPDAPDTQRILDMLIRLETGEDNRTATAN